MQETTYELIQTFIYAIEIIKKHLSGDLYLQCTAEVASGNLSRHEYTTPGQDVQFHVEISCTTALEYLIYGRTLSVSNTFVDIAQLLPQTDMSLDLVIFHDLGVYPI